MEKHPRAVAARSLPFLSVAEVHSLSSGSWQRRSMRSPAVTSGAVAPPSWAKRGKGYLIHLTLLPASS